MFAPPAVPCTADPPPPAAGSRALPPWNPTPASSTCHSLSQRSPEAPPPRPPSSTSSWLARRAPPLLSSNSLWPGPPRMLRAAGGRFGASGHCSQAGLRNVAAVGRRALRAEVGPASVPYPGIRGAGSGAGVAPLSCHCGRAGRKWASRGLYHPMDVHHFVE